MEKDIFKTIETKSSGFYKDRKSKFYSYAYPVESKDEIKNILKILRKEYHDARHHVYAYRLGADMKEYFTTDDGEPSNSSGPPIFGQIRSYDLTNIIIVVVRYFGGKKLGIPGLINAYKTAAKDAIENNKIITKTINEIFEINFAYNKMNYVMKIIEKKGINILEQKFTANCYIKLTVRKSLIDSFKTDLIKLRIEIK